MRYWRSDLVIGSLVAVLWHFYISHHDGQYLHLRLMFTVPVTIVGAAMLRRLIMPRIQDWMKT